MQYNNRKYLIRLKWIQLVAGVAMLLGMTAAIFLEKFLLLIYLGNTLAIGIFLVRILNFNFIRLQPDNGKIIIRFYALFSADRSYQSVEFPVSSLRKVKVRKYLFGMKWDLHITVKLKQGLAVYPPICLSAVPPRERHRLVNYLSALAVPL